MALVHPPTRSILFSTVAFKPIIVIVPGAELHAIMGGKELVTRIVTKIKAIKGISSFSFKEVGISQTVFVTLWCYVERAIVCSAVKRTETEVILWNYLFLGQWLGIFL